MINRETLVASIIEEEGFRASVYQDTQGLWTIGYGTLVDGRRGGAITTDEATLLLGNRLNAYIATFDEHLPWWRNLSDKRQLALCQMGYQLGWGGLRAFKKMLAAMEAGDFETAYNEALDSLWAKQTPSRANRVADMIRRG